MWMHDLDGHCFTVNDTNGASARLLHGGFAPPSPSRLLVSRKMDKLALAQR